MNVMDTQSENLPLGPAAGPIRVECLACGHERVFAADELAGAPLSRLTRRLRCSHCGSRAVRAQRVGDPPFSSPPKPRDIAARIRTRMR